MWYVYIVECSTDGTYYTGATNNLEKRIAAHNAGVGAKYTRGRRPVKLLKSFEVENRSSASKLEHKIKQLPRDEKLNMINSIEISSSTVLIGKEILNRLRLTPRMCASVRESYVAQVAIVLAMLQIQVDDQDLFYKYLGPVGGTLTTCLEPVDTEWAHAVIDNALKLIDNNVQR